MGNQTKTKDIRIQYDLPWQKNHWRSFETAYNKSPFFLYYQDYLIPLYQDRTPFLLDFNHKLLETLFQTIGFERTIWFTERYDKEPLDVDDKRLELDANHKPPEHPEYIQVFSSKHGFIPNLSILDLLFNLGPESLPYLRSF